MQEAIRVEILARRHDRAGFECSTGGLGDYLRKRAGQHVKGGAAAVFVAIYPSALDTILGYSTWSSLSLKRTDIPAQQQRGLARYPDVGVTLLGCLAVGVAHRCQHIGEFLLMDALRRLVSSSSTIAAVALVVDALDGSETFYTRYGFIHLGANGIGFLLIQPPCWFKNNLRQSLRMKSVNLKEHCARPSFRPIVLSSYT